MSTPRNRSHGGCWTCKARRRKCDQTRPACLACSERGVACEGYEVRLRWGSGIASRGRFTGAGEPVDAAVPVRAKGRRRDREKSRQSRMQRLGRNTYENTVLEENDSPEDVGVDVESPDGAGRAQEDEKLFQEFLSSGINILHSTSVNDAANLLEPQLPTICRQSDALYAVCLALQSSITPQLRSRFFEYFDAALHHFRSELARSATHLQDATFAAGLLLCSIGLVHGLPWTMHLRGMYGILQTQGLEHQEDTPFRSHLLEVMGVIDLPSFAIGRQNPSLGFWRRYCGHGRMSHDEVEVVSGLPRSLLDLFSCIGEGGATEEDFWNWPGARGSLLQCQLWEAYRLAGILTVRYEQLHFETADDNSIGQPARPCLRQIPGTLLLPETEVLVLRTLSSLEAIGRGSIEPEGKDSLILNAVGYPLFVAGLQATVDESEQLKNVVRKCYSYSKYRPTLIGDAQLFLGVLEEWWARSPDVTSIHQVVRSKGLELGLF